MTAKKINWEEIQIMQVELERLGAAIKECRKKEEYVKQLPLLKQREELFRVLKRKLEEAKEIADQNVKESLEEMLDFIQKEVLNFK